jgi:hypothetical protein
MTFSGYRCMFEGDNPLTGNPNAWSKTACLLLSVAVALLAVSGSAAASQVPPGCSTNGVAIDLQKSATNITNGQTVTYTVTLDNGAFPSCDAGNIVIQGFCPDLFGQPTILAKTFPPIANLPASTAVFTLGTFSCVVTINDGLSTAIARESLSGVLHDNPIADDVLSIQKDVSVLVATNPPPPPPPPPNAIPTLSEWVMVLLAVFLVVVGAIALRKRQTA